MTPRKLLPAVALPLALVLSLALAAACGGGSESTTASRGELTDPRSVPTASPWPIPPDVIPIEPGAITPLSGGGETPPPGEQTGGVTPESCGDTYTVKSGDSPSLIAEKCGVSLDQLLAANPGIEPTNLHIGDELTIPR